ncbi:MAG: hypothetical protein JWN02_129, partial [Acidobacteria bacterium]|nr:hypothetical protein [Acidobacteriota bacterium]
MERLLREWGGEEAATALTAPLTSLIGQGAYSRPVALLAEAAARNAARPWEVRRLAVLMLETSLVRIGEGGASSARERRFWIERLQLTDPCE